MCIKVLLRLKDSLIRQDAEKKCLHSIAVAVETERELNTYLERKISTELVNLENFKGWAAIVLNFSQHKAKNASLGSTNTALTRVHIHIDREVSEYQLCAHK